MVQEDKTTVPAETPVPEVKMVPATDLDALKSVYDKSIHELKEKAGGLEVELQKRDNEVAQLKEAASGDVVTVLEQAKTLTAKEGVLTKKEADLQARFLELKAKKLVLEHKLEGVEGFGVDDLVKLGSDTEMELAVLRQVAGGSTKPAPNLPATKDIPVGGVTPAGDVSTFDGRIDNAWKKALGGN